MLRLEFLAIALRGHLPESLSQFVGLGREILLELDQLAMDPHPRFLSRAQVQIRPTSSDQSIHELCDLRQPLGVGWGRPPDDRVDARLGDCRPASSVVLDNTEVELPPVE